MEKEDEFNVGVKSEIKKCNNNEKLDKGEEEKVVAQEDEESDESSKTMECDMLFNMSILICTNLLNYMDRFALAGVLTNVQAFYGINDADAGLLHTVFMVFFMFTSPVCGFFGDRYNRKWIMVFGLAVWISAVFASTFVPKDKFLAFLLLRGVFGLGEASYTTITPSIIADMFTGPSRSRMLMIFYFAIPFGSGLGFIVASKVSALTGHWTWGIRITVFFGIICLAMIIIFMKEPLRGAVERVGGGGQKAMVATSYRDDVVSLVKTPTYILSTAGYTALVFMVGTLSWWAATTIQHSEANKLGLNSTALLNSDVKVRINLIFGVLTCAGGIAGVGLGSVLSMMLHTGYGPFKWVQTIRSDAIICGVGSLIGVPALFLSLYFIPINITVAWAFIFILTTVSCFNFATHVDLLMDVVIPTRRNAANSWQILFSHMFGDASGPYIVGIISDQIRGEDSSPGGNFRSLVISFYLPNALLGLSAALFFCAAYTFVKDNHKMKRYMGALDSASETTEVPEGDVLPQSAASKSEEPREQETQDTAQT
ncbi:hypothetical protein RB195_015701 [Necator americanus]